MKANLNPALTDMMQIGKYYFNQSPSQLIRKFTLTNVLKLVYELKPTLQSGSFLRVVLPRVGKE